MARDMGWLVPRASIWTLLRADAMGAPGGIEWCAGLCWLVAVISLVCGESWGCIRLRVDEAGEGGVYTHH